MVIWDEYFTNIFLCATDFFWTVIERELFKLSIYEIAKQNSKCLKYLISVTLNHRLNIMVFIVHNIVKVTTLNLDSHLQVMKLTKHDKPFRKMKIWINFCFKTFCKHPLLWRQNAFWSWKLNARNILFFFQFYLETLHRRWMEIVSV